VVEHAPMNHDQIIQDTRDWVVKAVIGLNL
jgi:hypothetical protein